MNILNHYDKQLEQIRKEQEIVFKDVLDTFDKKFIMNFIEKIASVQAKINNNTKALDTAKPENVKILENNIRFNLYEYWLSVIETKLDLLQKSVIALLDESTSRDAESYRKEIYKNLITDEKQNIDNQKTR